jgi:hypothetical protein
MRSSNAHSGQRKLYFTLYSIQSKAYYGPKSAQWHFCRFRPTESQYDIVPDLCLSMLNPNTSRTYCSLPFFSSSLGYNSRLNA